MKLRLPHSLIHLLVAFAGASVLHAAVRHTDVSTMTYVDFATNSGRYVAGTTNELLEHIRQRDNGVQIHYTGGQSPYTLPHEMISFDSVVDGGHMTAIGYNYIVTVAHNNSQLSPTFTSNDYGIGAERSVKYLAVEEYGSQNSFVHHIFHDADDYKISRLTKLVTDVTPAQMAGGEGIDYNGALVYRVAGGLQLLRDKDGTDSDKSRQGLYSVGGVAKLTEWKESGTDEAIRVGTVTGTTSWKSDGVGKGSPLPFTGQEGDSGSPYFVWDGDAETGSYKFLMAHRASDKSTTTYGCEALEWTQKVMEADNVRVEMSRYNDGYIRIQGVNAAKDDDGKGGVSDFVNGAEFTVTPAKGYLADKNGWNIYDANGDSVAFNGVATGQHTWGSLHELKDKDSWYGYDAYKYLNAGPSVTLDKENNPVVTQGLTYAKLFMTQNLVFESAEDNARYTIDVTADTDLGAGYLHFAANGRKNVTFNVNPTESNQLDSAGYVVDAGVQVNVSLRNADANYMREWRKVGEGTLNICGEGNNEIFLNLGGTGETLLNQTKGGYAAYNVLVNTGSTVRINDVNQIKRDLTFGNGGGTLDMNGNSMAWYTTAESADTNRDGFSIKALTEEAVIANEKGHASLVYREEASTRFVGSFRDTKDASLAITYAGGGTWELNGIRTHLQHEGSGLTVENGTVKLAGTHTVHGYGTTHTYDTAAFSTRENDWHYADAAMNVKVKNGAAFELESHARLKGTVTVETGGRYIMHEGVQHKMEYIEGGEKQEETAAIADFYGHKGDVKLAGGATLSWQRGSTEVASLKGATDDGILADVESTIASDSSLLLSAAKGKEMGRIADARLTLAKSKTLELENVYVEAGASLVSEDGYLIAHGLTLELSDANSKVSDQKLWEDRDVISCVDGTILTLEKDTTVLDIQSAQLEGSIFISGSSLTMDLRGIAQTTAEAVRVYFSENVKFADAAPVVTALTAAGTLTGFYGAGEPGTVYFVASVPEPATATLSLLALTALAFRRRRSL